MVGSYKYVSMGHNVDFILLFEFYQTNLKIQSYQLYFHNIIFYPIVFRESTNRNKIHTIP